MNLRFARLHIFSARCALVCCTLAISLTAQASSISSVLEYRFPDSWDGSASLITDVSGAGHNANANDAMLLSNNVPPGTPAGKKSVNTTGGGFRTLDTQLLSNAAIAAASGFRIDTAFFWDGTSNGRSVQKIIDYSGTEFLQLEFFDFDFGTAYLRFGFSDNYGAGSVFAPIVANQWYDVTAGFFTFGNPIADDGSLSGFAGMLVNGDQFGDYVVKSSLGDNLNRPIGIGNFSGTSGRLLEFHGDIFRAKVALLPEPVTVMVAAFTAGVGILVSRRRRNGPA